MKTLKIMKTSRIQQDLLKNLPQQIMIDIFLRLPVQSIMSCKCVCKSWRDLIKTPEFVESHFSSSVPCLAVSHNPLTSDTKQGCHIIKFLDTENSAGENDYHFNVGLNLICPRETVLHSSANGLLFLSKRKTGDVFICNPITHEYIELPSIIYENSNELGFGVSKLSGEYKVVRLFSDRQNHQFDPPLKCEVYSLVQGLWRSVVSDQLEGLWRSVVSDQLLYAKETSLAVFSNGNLYWLVAQHSELGVTQQLQRILCFDLETECFSTFSVPDIPRHHDRCMCELGDCLCLFDSSRDGLVIWLMKKYGDDKSWTKEFVVEKPFPFGDHSMKVLNDGDILFINEFICRMYCYSSKTKTIQGLDALPFLKPFSRMFIYTPSFLPLKTLKMENSVISY